MGAGDPKAPFGRAMRQPSGAKFPVTVVTGFLGAGKTTLIRKLLDDPAGANTAVIVNEFGDVGIDNALLRASSDATVLLGNGCLCCSLRTDLQETLSSLLADRLRGAVPSFERVIIETSGLADPTPVLQTFLTDRALAREFHLSALIAVVDAATFTRTVTHAPEAQQQILLADRVIVTKADLVEKAAVEETLEIVRALAGASTPIELTRDGHIDPAFLLEPSIAHRAALEEHGFVTLHGSGVSSFSIILDEPLSWQAFSASMDMLATLRGPDLLRAKGLLAVKGCDGPVVVHYVQHLAHPPVELREWPDGDRRSRLVFITRGIEAGNVRNLLREAQAFAR